MEPVTHFLTGACIGRAGLNRKTAYATVAAVLAEDAAHIVAGVVVGGIWLWHSWRQRRGARLANALDQNAKAPPAPAPAPQQQQVRWAWLYLTALIAALSHLLLDWTNNYGLRPFFPFNPRWYAGSFVF